MSDARRTDDEIRRAKALISLCAEGLRMRGLPNIAMVADEHAELLDWVLGSDNSFASKLSTLESGIRSATACNN